jgi:hypothetical protein
MCQDASVLNASTDNVSESADSAFTLSHPFVDEHLIFGEL